MKPNSSKKDKMKKFLEYRQQLQKEAFEGLSALGEKDLVGMFGMLAEELIKRRRESELDIIRLEKFHPTDITNILRHQDQLDSYTRRLEACSALVRLLNISGSGELLKSGLIRWADLVISEIPLRS